MHMEKNKTATMPLSAAAIRLGVTYERAKRMLFIGELEGRQEDGRWYRVTVASVDRFQRERERHLEPTNA